MKKFGLEVQQGNNTSNKKHFILISNIYGLGNKDGRVVRRRFANQQFALLVKDADPVVFSISYIQASQVVNSYLAVLADRYFLYIRDK